MQYNELVGICPVKSITNIPGFLINR